MMDEQQRNQMADQLEKFNLDDMQREIKTKHVDDKEKLNINRINEQIKNRLSSVEQLGRNSLNEMQKLEKNRETVEKREEEDDFKRNLDNDAVDRKDYQNLKKLLESYREILSNMVLMHLIQNNDIKELQNMVSSNKFIHDQNYVMTQINYALDKYEKSMEKMVEKIETIADKND